MARQLGRAVSRAGAGGALVAMLSVLASCAVATGSLSPAAPTSPKAAVTNAVAPGSPSRARPAPAPTPAPALAKAAITTAVAARSPSRAAAPPSKATATHKGPSPKAGHARSPAKGGGTVHAVLANVTVKTGAPARRPTPTAGPRTQPVPRAVTSTTAIEQWVPHLRPVPPAPKRVQAPRPRPAPRAVRAAKAPSRSLLSYPAGATGYDISQYQCNDIPAARSAVAIVQVSGGALASAPNPCYVQEASWAGSRLSTYIYLNGLSGPALDVYTVGPRSWCARAQPVCRAYNFGFDWASHWLAYSRRLGINPKLWWLDVEVGSGWTFPMINDGVIQGAANALRSQGVTVGIYSTTSQWATITGGLTFPGVQLWTAGAGNITGPGQTATAYCKSSGDHAFAGGLLKLVQWGYTGGFPGAYPALAPYDYDYVCN